MYVRDHSVLCAYRVICKTFGGAFVKTWKRLSTFIWKLRAHGLVRCFCPLSGLAVAFVAVICKTFRGAFVRVELAGIEPASLSFVQDGFTQVETITAPP